MLIKKYISVFLLTTAIALTGCQKDVSSFEDTIAPKIKVKIEFLKDLEINKEEFIARIASSEGTNSRLRLDFNSIISSIIANYVSFSTVTYPTTDVNGNQIEVSGLVIAPKYDGQVPMISFQHGTIEDPNSAPSLLNPGTRDYYQGALVAALGYIIVVPDYLGYGVTSNMPHPYMHRATLASATADMILAMNELKQNGTLKWNSKLYLAGYSEGGYATMGAHKLLQEQYASILPVTAVSYGAGAYDITNTAKYFLTRDEDRSAFYIRAHIWTLLTYNDLYPQLKRPIRSFVIPPYDSILMNTPLLSAQLPLNPQQLMEPTFKAAVLNGTDTSFLDVLADNDVYNWKPESPVLLVHSTGDSTVPILNSESAYNSFSSQGVNVRYVMVQGKSHGDAAVDYLYHTLLFFRQY